MTGENTPIDGVEAPQTSPDDAADALTLAPPVAPPVAPPSAASAVAPPSASSAPLAMPGLGSETPSVLVPPADYTQAGVPSLDFVRDKIEGRYAQSLGSTELAAETPEARSFEEQAAKRAEAAKEKLDAIRRSLRGDSSS